MPKGRAYSLHGGEIPVCNILGVRVAAINMEGLLDFLDRNLPQLKGEYLCVSNVHTTVTAYDDPAYRRIQNNAVMAIPDGGPLSSLGRKRGFPGMERTTGPDLMGEIFSLSARKGYRHYFYGSTRETLDVLRERLEARYPGMVIAGMYSPPFRPVTAEEDGEIVRKINESRPDFIWIGLGAPKQELWMSDHRGRLEGLMIGVGAGFDYYAGNIRRAPQWMQAHSLEWLYRLLQDPKRLFMRYFCTNTRFIWHAVIRGE